MPEPVGQADVQERGIGVCAFDGASLRLGETLRRGDLEARVVSDARSTTVRMRSSSSIRRIRSDMAIRLPAWAGILRDKWAAVMRTVVPRPGAGFRWTGRRRWAETIRATNGSPSPVPCGFVE